MNTNFHRFNKPVSTMKNMKDLKKYIETERPRPMKRNAINEFFLEQINLS